MVDGDQERELRDEWVRLDAETADGELSANDVAEKMRRKAEIEAEMQRLGIEVASTPHEPATYRDPT